MFRVGFLWPYTHPIHRNQLLSTMLPQPAAAHTRQQQQPQRRHTAPRQNHDGLSCFFAPFSWLSYPLTAHTRVEITPERQLTSNSVWSLAHGVKNVLFPLSPLNYVYKYQARVSISAENNLDGRSGPNPPRTSPPSPPLPHAKRAPERRPITSSSWPWSSTWLGKSGRWTICPRGKARFPSSLLRRIVSLSLC